MPWSCVDLMSIRLEFVAEALGRRRSIAALCAQYGISEKTAYKWLARFRRGGPAALADGTHAPHACPHRTPPEQAARILALRRQHPTWGPRKLRAVLREASPTLVWPAASTITTLLHRAGLVTRRRRRRAAGRPGGERGPCAAHVPNALWTLDYKGQFRTGDGRWCYPLTIVDAASRFLLACVAHPAPTTAAAHRVLARCFRTYGLPTAILSDNGPPFGAQAPRGFSRLSLWFRSLGIAPRFTVPGHPEHNGRHERLHRTLKADVLRPPAATRRAQQAAFDAFRTTYNTTRPHEALALKPPVTVYTPSSRRYRGRAAPLSYPPHMLTRRVSAAGVVWIHQAYIYISQTYAGYPVGLEPRPQAQGALFDVFFAEYLLGTLDLTTTRFMPLTDTRSSPINPV